MLKMMFLEGDRGCLDLKEWMHFPVQDPISPWGSNGAQLGAGCTQHRNCSEFALQLLCSCQDSYWKNNLFSVMVAKH